MLQHCYTGKQGGSTSSLARPCSGRLLGGSASQQEAGFSLSSIAAQASALSACPAAAESADLQPLTAWCPNAPPSLLGFSLSEPADSAAYIVHAAPRDVTDLWASPRALPSDAAAASDGAEVRLVPVAQDAVPEAAPQQWPCSSGSRVSSPGMPALLADDRAGGDELAVTAQALVRQALAAAGGTPQKQVHC